MKKTRHSLLTAALLGAASLTSSHANDLIWTGAGANNNWQQNSNWTGDATNFANGDNVSFTDSGLTPRPSILLNGAFTVGTMTVSNTSDVYTISASGANTLTGTTLTKSGAGTLEFTANGNVTFANTTLNGGTLIIRQATFNGGAISLTGDTTVSNNSNGAGTLAGTSLTGSSVLNITPYNNSGVFVLGQTLDTSAFTGTIRNSVGGRVNVLNSSANLEQAKVELSGGATFQTQSTVTVKIGEITADSSTTLGSGFGAASIFEIGGRNTNSAIAGVIQNGGFANNGNVTTGNIGLTKVGTGDLSLTGANTYTGATTVNAGTLLLGDGVSGSITSAVTVTTGAFFGNLASGDITTAAVTIGNGTGSADASFGAGRDVIGRFASSGGLSLLSDANFVFDLNSGTETTDIVTFGGVVSLNGVFTLNDLNTGAINWSVGDSFTVVSGSSLSGTFSNLAHEQTITVNGVDYEASYSGSALTLTVTSVIPEPGTWSFLLAAGLVMTACKCRRPARA